MLSFGATIHAHCLITTLLIITLFSFHRTSKLLMEDRMYVRLYLPVTSAI